MKTTVFTKYHIAAGAKMAEFAGYNMPIEFTGINDEHMAVRNGAGVFDVSHMGEIWVKGPRALDLLQRITTNDVSKLFDGKVQYTCMPNGRGGIVDDILVYRVDAETYMLCVNAANIDKDWKHICAEGKAFGMEAGHGRELYNASDEICQLAVQGPLAMKIVQKMCAEPVEGMEYYTFKKMPVAGCDAILSITGYTGSGGCEIYVANEDGDKLWKALWEAGAEFGLKNIGLGARDTLRLEAALPLYGHEMGLDPAGNEMPIFAVPLAKFAVSFAPQKGDFIGRKPLEQQFAAFKRIMNRDFSDLSVLPRRIQPITLLDRGVMRAGMPVYRGEKQVGWVTSGTMVPYYVAEGEGLQTVITDETAKRAIGLCYIDSDILTDDTVEVDIRGKRLKAVIPANHMSVSAPPFARPLLYRPEEKDPVGSLENLPGKAFELLKKAEENHLWRQKQCINLIPSENTPSHAVQMLSASDPSCRYAEHKKVLSFYDKDIFYYQGTKFIDEVERLLVEQMRLYLGCAQVETRVVSGQMSNMATFSALMDWKNRLDRKHTPQRLGYVMNNHIIKGGHLSAQPMGALRDYVAVDPKTERTAVVNFPVCCDNIYKIDVEGTKKLIDEYRPELIIFGKSMVLHREPVAEIRAFVDAQNIPTTIMYDMAHVLGLIGDHFQNPFADGAEIVTGSTHKTFFGPQRGVIGVNYQREDLKWGLWEAIESRTFPGSVSNHHLGTQLGMLMAAYEMNHFKDAYQSAIIANAKHFARALKAQGLDVQGDPAIDYTETHQVIVSVGYGTGPEVAERLEENNIIVNYQATPEEEGFTASGALRMGVSEMTRFGFGPAEFDELASLMADCILRGKDISEDVVRLRSRFTKMHYCFNDAEFNAALDRFAGEIGF